MSGKRAAIRYAKAILSLANDKQAAEAVNADMSLMANTIAQSKDLALLLQSPIVKSEEKVAVLAKIFAEVNPMSSGLINVLAENKRLNLLEATANAYSVLFDEVRGVQKAIVTTAAPLTDEVSAKVLAKVKELTGKDAVIDSRVDESIVGGFVLRVGDLEYNASIANKLNNLKRTFSQN